MNYDNNKASDPNDFFVNVLGCHRETLEEVQRALNARPTPPPRLSKIGEMISFLFEEQVVRGATWEGKPVIAAIDVCNCLEIVNSRDAIQRLPDAEKVLIGNADGNPRSGIPHQLTFITEPGLYRLIFTSRKKKAEAFQQFILHEVLPQIAATGSYSENLAPASEPPPAPSISPTDLPPILQLHREHFQTLVAAGVSPTTACRSADKIFDSWKQIPQLIPAAPPAPKGDLQILLAGMLPGEIYSVNELVSLLPERHPFRRKDVTQSANNASIGHLMLKGIKQDLVELVRCPGRRHAWQLRQPDSAIISFPQPVAAES